MVPRTALQKDPTGGLLQVTPPLYGPNAPLPEDEPVVGEQPVFDESKISAVEKLLGQFNQEIDLADYGRRDKEWKWIKIDKYNAGKDVNEPRDDYEESTFFYRRLPRIVQIGKQKLYKHVWPIQGRPWEIKASPRRRQGDVLLDQEERLSHLRQEFEDIHESMEMENFLDDMTLYLSNYGTAVTYGPIVISNPRLRFQDGSDEIPPEDKRKPMWMIFDPRTVYPDPNGKHGQELEYVYFHHVWSSHQLRSLKEDAGFILSEVADLIHDDPSGNWAGNLKRWEYSPFHTNISNAALNRYVVWMRVGILTKEALKDLGEKFPKNKDLTKAQTEDLTDSMWEIWFSGKKILKISKRKFQPAKMPVGFIPFRRDPGSIFGIGAGESALECVEMLTNIVRSIDDDMADTSGFQAMIDAGAVENKDLRVRGRKTWIYRNKGTARKEGPSGRPVEFFKVPSNLEHLLECFKLFESMLPICTGITEMVTGLDMGSGVRTDQMMTDVWASLEEFLRDTVGNVDRYWWKPHLRDTYQWIQEQYPDWEQFKIEADFQVQGVRGALKREIVGRKAEAFFTKLKQAGYDGWIDEIQYVKVISEGIGIEEETAVLTPKQFIEKKALEAQEEELKKRAGMKPEQEVQDKERAHTSTRDAMMDVFKQSMAVGKDGLMPPIAIPAAEKLFGLTGEIDAKVIAAMSIWTKMLAKQYAEAGVATDQEAKTMEAPLQAHSPLELAPGARNPQEAAAAPANPAPKTPPNPVPAVPTTQQTV
jgi:hypothetical protein